VAVSSTLNRVSYVGNAVTLAFAFPYYFQAVSDLVVLSIVTATGVQTGLVYNVDYTISGAVDANGFYSVGGSVNCLVAPPSTVTLVIYRDPTRTQPVVHVDGDALLSSSIDGPLDKLTMIAQRHDDMLARTLTQPDGDVSTIARIPAAILRINGGAGSFAGYDASGNPTAFTNAGAVGASVAISTAMVPVVQASTLAVARAAMGIVIPTVRTVLAAPITLYVATTGSDGNTGLLGSPMATVANAYLKLQKNYDLAGQVALIQIADGTYAEAVAILNGPVTGQVGPVYIQGNVSLPGNVSFPGMQINNGAFVQVQSLQFNFSGATINTLVAQFGATIFLGPGLRFGNTGAPQGGSHILAQFGATVQLQASSYTVNGNASWHLEATWGASIYASTAAITISAPNFNGGYALAQANSVIVAIGCTFPGAASMVGAKYQCNYNSTLYVGGAGINYLPGNAPGSVTGGGQYV
jgi:hypothetical protein